MREQVVVRALLHVSSVMVQCTCQLTCGLALCGTQPDSLPIRCDRHLRGVLHISPPLFEGNECSRRVHLWQPCHLECNTGAEVG